MNNFAFEVRLNDIMRNYRLGWDRSPQTLVSKVSALVDRYRRETPGENRPFESEDGARQTPDIAAGRIPLPDFVREFNNRAEKQVRRATAYQIMRRLGLGVHVGRVWLLTEDECAALSARFSHVRPYRRKGGER